MCGLLKVGRPRRPKSTGYTQPVLLGRFGGGGIQKPNSISPLEMEEKPSPFTIACTRHVHAKSVRTF
jgi:hypothetical protein